MTITISEKIHKLLKINSAESGEKIYEIVEKAIVEYLKKGKK